jgi:hypothetical protein
MGYSHFILNLAQGVRKGYPYDNDYHNTTRRHPNAASAVTYRALAPKALRKWHLRSVKKPFGGEPKKTEKAF